MKRTPTGPFPRKGEAKICPENDENGDEAPDGPSSSPLLGKGQDGPSEAEASDGCRPCHTCGTSVKCSEEHENHGGTSHADPFIDFLFSRFPADGRGGSSLAEVIEQFAAMAGLSTAEIRAGAFIRDARLRKPAIGAWERLQEARCETGVRSDRRTLPPKRFGSLVHAAPESILLVERAKLYAARDGTVLITGPTGSGKEVFAREIHKASPRCGGPFVALNCAAFSASLIESELFGHVRGAFTDARAESRGLFVLADGGTLFLDELGEMPLSLQPKLLRAVQERKVRPVGGKEEIPFDVRIIAATNRPLEALVAAGTFRADLFYRLNVLRLQIPPLRRRRGDIAVLAEHFLAQEGWAGPPATGFTDPAWNAITAHDWPGGVRELQNVIARARVLAGVTNPIDIEHLDMGRRPAPERTVPGALFLGGSLPPCPPGRKPNVAYLSDALRDLANGLTQREIALKSGHSRAKISRDLQRLRERGECDRGLEDDDD